LRAAIVLGCSGQPLSIAIMMWYSR
jgi:hypothetical protein